MSHLVKLIIFSIVISGSVVCWNLFIPAAYTTTHIYYALPFFITFSIITQRLYDKALKSTNNNAFTTLFLGITGIKLFISLIIIVIYGFVNKPGIIPFAILFLFVYLAFSMYETIALFRTVKQLKQTQLSKHE